MPVTPPTVPALRAALRLGPLEFGAAGVSMRPLLRAGDRVRLENRAPQRGDVALVALESGLVLHRLLRRRGGRWLLRGDARRRADGWIHGDQILAVATARRRVTTHPGRGDWRRLDTKVARWLGLAWGHCAPGLLGLAALTRARDRGSDGCARSDRSGHRSQ
jgi:hypothetical protein